MKPNIVFFSRSYQNKLFPFLISDKYNSIHVTLTREEKRNLIRQGIEVKYCFEEFTNVDNSINVENYLYSSFVSDRFLNVYDTEFRIKFLKREISFWIEIFEEYNPLAVINEQVAIEIAEVLYIESKKRNLRYLAWMNSPINGYFYWIDDPTSLSLGDVVLNTKPSDKSLKIADDYLENIVAKQEKPYYLAPYLNKTKLRNLYSGFRGTLISFYKEFITKSEGKYERRFDVNLLYLETSIKSLYKKYDSIENLKDYDIVLYPLHYEPEASLSYLSEFNSNQVALIENINKCLKEKQVLIVKEHPAQSGKLLSRKYQELKKKLSSLYYLPHNISSYDIIKHSKLIITLTSHLGWEALIMGKPVYLLGKMFYDKYEKINIVSTFDELKTQIRSGDYKYPDQTSLREFLAKIIERSSPGEPFPGKNLYQKQNLLNIVSAIENELGLD